MQFQNTYSKESLNTSLLGKSLSNFVSPNLKLHKRYYILVKGSFEKA